MKKFKDITVFCGDEATAISELKRIEDACVIPEFKYDEEVEKMYEPDDKMAHILATVSNRPQAVLLVWADKGNIRVINVVPFNRSVFRIEVDDYNAIIDEFYSKIVKPVVGERHKVIVTSGNYTLEDIIPQSFPALVKWTTSATAPPAARSS